MVSILVSEYLVFCCDRFGEPRIYFCVPYQIQGMGIEWSKLSYIQLVLEGKLENGRLMLKYCSYETI